MKVSRHSRVDKVTLRRISARVMALALPYKTTLLAGFVALALGSGINLIFPYVIRLALNESYGMTLAKDLPYLVLILIALFALQAAFFYVRHYCFYAVGFHVVAALRDQLFGALMKQDIAFFDRSRVGDLLSRLSADTDHVQRAVTVNLSVAVRYALQVIGGTVLMLIISVELTAIIICIIPLIVFASIFWGRRLRMLSKRMQEDLGEASVVSEEAMGAIRTVRIFGGNGIEEQRYSNAIAKALQTGLRRAHVGALFSSVMVFVIHSAIAAVVWLGGEFVLSGSLSIGDLTAFVLYCVIVAVSFGFLANTWDEFMRAVGASERIFEIIDSVPLIQNTSESPAATFLPGAPHLAFTDVSFVYPSRPEQGVLSEITFSIPQGSTLALVGPSGAGKSTIAALIPRFYDVTSGAVLYRGVDIRQLDLNILRRKISVVEQNPQVFSRSIKENIRYGREEASDSEIEQVAKAASIHDFILSLPDGYDTLVGDRGVLLSGGERQRLAIARAILKDPEILILDEATSALDSENEQLVQSALEILMKNRTTLIVAHRLSTVKNADQVIVLEQGQIIQSGNHDSLVSKPGLYQTLVEYQLLSV